MENPDTNPLERFLWEILVPCQRNDGRPIRTRFHRVWDEKVRKVSGGLTILPPAKGQWVSKNTGKLFVERMIPARVLATEAEINEIVDFTMNYYEQEAVLAYKIGVQVILREKNPGKTPVKKRREDY